MDIFGADSRWLTGACLILVAGCATVATDGASDLVDDSDGEDGEVTVSNSEALTLSAPVPMRSGAWWGDTKTPLINQLWGEVLNATPGKNLTQPFTFKWTCNLPVFDGFSNTLKLSHAMLQFNGKNLMDVRYPSPGAVQSYVLDPAAFPAGWGELRIRCLAKETQGPEAGNTTAITAGFAVQIRGGTGSLKWGPHSGTDYVDTHGWYDRGVGYVYATILNVSEVVGKTLSGVQAFKLRARNSGDTTVDHFMVKIDDQIATTVDGHRAEFAGVSKDRTLYIDTRQLSNGTHTFAMHTHGIENSSSEQPGQQIAGQVEVTITVKN